MAYRSCHCRHAIVVVTSAEQVLEIIQLKKNTPTPHTTTTTTTKKKKNEKIS